MKKNKKIFAAAAALTGILLSALSGCGKEDTGETQQKPEGLVYVPEYAELFETNDGDYIYAAAASGDNLFICAQNWDEEAQTSSNFIYKYNIMDGTNTKIPMDIGEDCSVSTMAIGTDGDLYMVANRNTYEEDENGEMTNWSSSVELWIVSSEDGSTKSTNDITALLDGNSEYTYVQYFSMDGEGNYYLYDGDKNLLVLGKDYQKICSITTDDWISNMAVSKEGDVYVAIYGSKGVELRKVDLTAKALGSPIEGIVEQYGNSSIFTGTEKSFLVTSSDQVSRVDIASGEKEDLFKWLDMDVNGDNIRYAGELSDGRIWAMINDYNAGGNSTNELVFAVQKDASEVPVKEEIVLGTMYIDYNIKRNIIDFNKKNQQYRITVKEYGREDYAAGRIQFQADLTSANCPDIISLSSINYDQYVTKGVFEDVYPYMEKSGINRSDFLENVIQAFEVDGKLYGVMPQFYVDTTIAKTALVGDRTGWTLSEMLDFAEKSEANNIFSYGTRSGVFYYCIYNNIDEFVNWETGECFFEGDDFIRVLEFAAKFPDDADYNYNEEEGISSKLRNDRVMLLQNTITSVQSYQMMQGMFGEPISFVGYPNNERMGNLIQPSSGSLAMSAKSEKKDGAWEFMKTLISEEYQNSLVSDNGGSNGFPILKSALEAQFKVDMTPNYITDENGEKVEGAKTHWGWDDFSMEIMAATQEEVDAVRNLITSTNKLGNSGSMDSKLSDILTEESEAFFKGQKSAKDVAGVIQNRIQIYVNENR